MAERSRDWLRQAEVDLRQARSSLDAGFYEWAAFAAHQAAEKAIKAVFQKLHLEAWGHSLSALVQSLPAQARPEASLIGKETLARIKTAIEELPPKHREVIVLRDVAQLDAAEVGTMLGISAENQRVRLHRARAAVRKALEDYLA